MTSGFLAYLSVCTRWAAPVPGVSPGTLSDPLPNLDCMETLRVLIDSSDPCVGCGAPTTVFQRTDDSARDIEWADEHRECSHGCDEFAAAIPVGEPVRARRRRRVA